MKATGESDYRHLGGNVCRSCLAEKLGGVQSDIDDPAQSRLAHMRHGDPAYQEGIARNYRHERVSGFDSYVGDVVAVLAMGGALRHNFL